jgi:PAS domain S-box-containing protein
MTREHDPTQPTLLALSRLTQATRRIQTAVTEEESLRFLGEAATELVGAERAVARLGDATGAPSAAIGFPLVAASGEAVGVLEVEPRSGAPLGEVEAALLRQLAQIGAWAIEDGRLRSRLLEHEERLTLALEAASVGTWEHVPSSHATFWDNRSKAVFGYPADEELTFERYVSALHPDDKDYVFAGITKATDPQGKGECSLEYRIRLPNGDERWVEAHGRSVFSDGVAQRIHGTLVDTTARKQAEEAVREAARRKDEFLALLGHELRNPLAPIRTALELMRLRLPEQAVREREVIERQVEHMMRLVDDLLDLARIARGSITLRREPQDLASVVARAAEIASPLLEQHQHRLDVDVLPGLGIDVDPVRFTQVVANLLTNAAKFTPRGGRISVRGRRQGDEITLQVEDTGIGIEARDLERIFEPFVQAIARHEHAYGGLGLGLSLVRDLVNLHGGRVAAFSDGRGRGSTFVIYLPRGAERAAEVRPAPSSEPRAPGRRILIVDDNEDAAEMLAIVLGELGHEVRLANDGPRALVVAAELVPEIAVLDLGLPVMDGYELASRLLEEYGARGIRLVAITGYGQLEDRERTRAAGFDTHLVKPVDLKELRAALSA